MAKFRTTAAYVSGAICGHLWMPETIGGFPHRFDIRDTAERWSDPGAWTFRELLLAELTRHGGDFQDARFSADSVIRVERRAIDAPGKYRVHVRELSIADLPDCGDLVHADTFAGDFFGEAL